jgi:pimeloyl-ACP methyl ester carboxylesterase
MSRIALSDIEIEYDLVGEPGAPAVAVTPGGRLGKDSPGLRELAEALAAGGNRVLLWDRPNCGASDICFTGESESDLQARTLAQLIRALDLGPTALGGGSAGARVSLIAAANDPDSVSHLLLWWLSGGVISLLTIGTSYYGESAAAAMWGGMLAVAGLPSWAQQIKNNPRNRDAILKQDPDQFIATMERWASAFIPSETSPVPDMVPMDFARLTMPVLIFRGSTKDIYHPAQAGERVHALIPHSELVDTPWSDDAGMERIAASRSSGIGHLLDWPRLAPAISEFISRADVQKPAQR